MSGSGRGMGHLPLLLLQAPTISQALVSHCFILSVIKSFFGAYRRGDALGGPDPWKACREDGCAQLLSSFSCKVKEMGRSHLGEQGQAWC